MEENTLIGTIGDKMKIKKAITIDGTEVTLLKTFDGISVFIAGDGAGDTDNRFFFIRGEQVIQIMDIECGMGQGTGYVESIAFIDVK